MKNQKTSKIIFWLLAAVIIAIVAHNFFGQKPKSTPTDSVPTNLYPEKEKIVSPTPCYDSIGHECKG